jgi:hypothetical protein
MKTCRRQWKHVARQVPLHANLKVVMPAQVGRQNGTGGQHNN